MKMARKQDNDSSATLDLLDLLTKLIVDLDARQTEHPLGDGESGLNDGEQGQLIKMEDERQGSRPAFASGQEPKGDMMY
jgi:hypothetical protein